MSGHPSELHLFVLWETARRVAPDHPTVLFVARELDALRAAP